MFPKMKCHQSIFRKNLLSNQFPFKFSIFLLYGSVVVTLVSSLVYLERSFCEKFVKIFIRFEHLGVTEDLGGGYTLEMRAEVGLLSRNVKVIGSRDQQWSDEIEACPDGFDTGNVLCRTIV